MKIATFNVNNINKRLANLLDWLANAEPDVVCLQELKAADTQFPQSAIAEAGYGAIWRGESAWNGVAILARGADPVETRNVLPGDEGDAQARYIEAAVGGVLVACLYAPNGNPQPGPKFAYKLKWMERFAAHAAALMASGAPVVLAGDYNIVPTPFDIYDSKASYKTNALVQPAPRAAYARLLEAGWTDAIRHLYPEERVYSFWDYLRDAWQRDAGLRLDHLLLSADLVPRLTDAGIDRWVRGEAGASDHAPVWIELGPAPAGAGAATAAKTGRRAPARRAR